MKTRVLVVLLIIFILLIATITGLIIGYRYNQKPRAVKISSEQQELIEEAGYPDTFAILISDNHRYEIWSYYDMRTSFYFVDGRYIRADNTLKPLPKGAVLPKIKPTSFPNNISLTQINKLLDDEPAVVASVEVEGVGSIKGYQYLKGIFVGTRNSKVTFIQTQAYEVKK